MSRHQLQKRYTFEAAHRNTQGDERTGRLHGHNFVVRVFLEDEINERSGWFADYAEIDALVLPVLSQVDHQFLNDVIRRPNARLADIADWMKEQMSAVSSDVRQVIVELESGAPEFRLIPAPAEPVLDYPERVGFYVECAHLLPAVYEEHKCGSVHGHSFRIEVAAACAPEVLEPLLREIHDTLDHRFLNEIPGLENPTSELLAEWVWRWLEEKSGVPQVIIIHETPDAYCVYRGPNC